MIFGLALGGEQRGIDVAIDIDRAFGELILQLARTRAFGDAECSGRVAVIRLRAIELHEDVDIERVIRALGAEIARAQIRRADPRALRFDQRERLLDLAACVGEIARRLRDAREARMRDGLPGLIVGFARELQRLLRSPCARRRGCSAGSRDRRASCRRRTR